MTASYKVSFNSAFLINLSCPCTYRKKILLNGNGFSMLFSPTLKHKCLCSFAFIHGPLSEECSWHCFWDAHKTWRKLHFISVKWFTETRAPQLHSDTCISQEEIFLSLVTVMYRLFSFPQKDQKLVEAVFHQKKQVEPIIAFLRYLSTSCSLMFPEVLRDTTSYGKHSSTQELAFVYIQLI